MSDDSVTTINPMTLLDLTARIVSAYAGNATLTPTELTETIGTVSRALSNLSTGSVVEPTKAQEPAIAIKKSVTADFIICLEDGKKLKMLKRHLMSTYGMTPQDYRLKWNLPRDYPMVAPNYAATRSQLAKKIGLGRSPAKVVPPAKAGKAPAAAPAPARRGRPKKVVAAA
jgi:predicted transcriptional regulator